MGGRMSEKVSAMRFAPFILLPNVLGKVMLLLCEHFSIVFSTVTQNNNAYRILFLPVLWIFQQNSYEYILLFNL